MREKRSAAEFAAHGGRQIRAGAVLLIVGVLLSIGLFMVADPWPTARPPHRQDSDPPSMGYPATAPTP